jgi:hypothetical protein
MSAITLQIPDDLVERLRSRQERLPEILELGLRELDSDPRGGFEGAADVIEFLATLPGPEEILALGPSERLQHQVKRLLEKSRAEGLTPAEDAEWARYEYLEHLVRMAKARACMKLGIPPDSNG